MLKKTYFLIALVLTSILVYSQENIVEQKIAPVSLVTSRQVVFELREKYGVKGSVELTKTLWQVLNSYNNQQQTKAIWQSAVSNVTTDTDSITPIVSSHYNAGAVLINYINGMSAKKWNANRRLTVVKKEKLDDFFKMNDELTIYFNLLPVWDLLLEDVNKQANINWQDIFQKSLHVFQVVEQEQEQEEPEPESLVLVKSKTELDLRAAIINSLSVWNRSENKTNDLAVVMQNVDLLKEKSLNHAVIRYVLAKDSGQLLSSAMTWFALSQQLVGEINAASEVELNFYSQFVEENDTWFLTQEQALMAVDVRLLKLVESNFYQLKAFIKNPKAGGINQLTTVYELSYSKLAKYMDSPFRKRIRKDLEVCLNISEEIFPYPQEPIDEKQFKGCIDDIYYAAVNESESRELSGTLIKVENQQALDRALELPVWQIVNIIYANLASVECLKSAKQLPNPFEWTLAAESMLWFADRWPAYIQNFKQKNKVQRIVNEGKVLVNGLSCTAGMRIELLDAEFNRVLQSWKKVETDIQKVVEEFNAVALKEGSDLDLINGARGKSNYRVKGAKIAACDVKNSCGVLVDLEPSRALYSLFPSHLLMADQLKQGNVKLCYDNVGWENRRTAPTHLDNNNVANYMGKFSFSLKGYYNEKLVFSRKITDKQEYNYIFAANTKEVLDTYCPLSIVGDKISTKLERGTFGLVPNRLTFLTASRVNETDILVGNWESGEEWKNAILSEKVEVVFEDSLDNLKAVIIASYQDKAKQLQDIIYRSILNKQKNATQPQKDLAASFATMQRHKKLLFAYNYLLQMDKLMQDDDLHGLFFGNNKVVDIAVIKRHFANQVNINLLTSEIKQNLKSNQEKWNALPKKMSNSHIQSILYRLNTIYP